MICATIGKRSRQRRLFACAVALAAVLGAAPSAPAAWERTAVGAGGAAGVYLTLKKNLLGRLSDQFSRMGDAFLKDDDKAFLEAAKEHEEAPLHIVKDAVPVFAAASAVRKAAGKAGEKFKRMAASVKRKAGRFVGGAREAVVDARVALTGLGREDRGLAREIFDPEPLPEVKVFSRPRPVPTSPWDAKGPVSAAAKASPWDAHGLAAGKADPWAKSAWDPDPALKGKPASPAKPSSSFRTWVEAEQRSRPNCYGVVSEDCDGSYREALLRMTGEAEGGYEEQLAALEAKERARLAAEQAERERLEAEWRARERARLAAEQAEQERLEAERRARESAERRRVEAEKERRRARLAAKEVKRRERLEARRQARESAERRRVEAEKERRRTRLAAKEARRRERLARKAGQRRRQEEIAWQRQQEQEQAWRRQQQRRQARVRQEEEERRRRQEAERQRQEAERQRREDERLAKAARRAACRRQISGARNGCVQVVKWHGVGAFGGTYTLRNSCSYSVKVWHGRQDRRLDSLMTIPPGGTRDTAPAFGEPYNDGSMRWRRLRISYLACYDAPAVSRSGGACVVQPWACAIVE